MIEVCRLEVEGKRLYIAQGYETIHGVTAQVEGETVSWQECCLLLQSRAATQTVQERLQKVQQALAELVVRRQGKPRLSERMQVEEAVKSVLKQFRVDDLLQVQILEHVQDRVVRAYRGRVLGMRRELTFMLPVERVYAINHQASHLTLEHTVETYRDEYLVERNFSRLKGHPLSLAPFFVQRDDHRVGLVRLLTLALRVLRVLESVVRQLLAAQQEELAGQFVDNPTRPIAQPTAGRLL